jgi:type III pantothenate kinase
MKVVVDIGNSHIKWARAAGGRLEAPGRASHRESVSGALDALIEALPEQVDRVLVANVAGDVLADALGRRLRDARCVEPQFVSGATPGGGVRVVYADPARLGADRWAAMIAAHNRYPGPVCVIDAGTTVTFDAVDAEGQHLGGLILAGPRMTADALQRDTQGVRATVDVTRRPFGLDVLGKSTDEAVGLGVMLALSGAIDRAAEAVADALGLEPTVLLTGGGAHGLQPWLKTAVRHSEYLVLEGLALLA